MRCSRFVFTILLSGPLAFASAVSLPPPDPTGLACQKWYSVLEDLQADLFAQGQCNDYARQSLRITYHDAVGHSLTLQNSGQFGGGGADGSLIKYADTELSDREYPSANKGLQDIVLRLKTVADTHGVSYGDTIQFAGAVGLSNCRGAPRLSFFAGRPDATAPAPPHLFPKLTDPVEAILARLLDAGLSAEDTIALLGAHSIGKERTIDPSLAGTPLDSTSAAFDSQYHLEVLLKGAGYPNGSPPLGAALSAPRDVFRLASDAAIARHPQTACMWQSYIGNDDSLQTAFRRAMDKVATLGQDPSNLIDCSAVIPVPPARNTTVQYPTGFGPTDIERSCDGVAFPVLPQD